MTILVVSPHRDDAAFSLTLTLAAWLRAGHQITVVNCFTRSDYAPFADTLDVHPNDRISFVSALRKREDEAWRRMQKSDALLLNDLDLKMRRFVYVVHSIRSAPYLWIRLIMLLRGLPSTWFE